MRRSTFFNVACKHFGCRFVDWGGSPLKPKCFSLGSRHVRIVRRLAMSPAITDVPGVLVGHAQDLEALTGCTVVLTTGGAVGGVDVRGGGPGTRETDLLDPTANVSVVHAIALCGGSAFGLAAASGVVDWLRERDIGFPTRVR